MLRIKIVEHKISQDFIVDKSYKSIIINIYVFFYIF